MFLLDNSAPDKIPICGLLGKTQHFQETVGQSLKTQIYYFFVSCRTPTVGQNTKINENYEISRFCLCSLSWTNNKQQNSKISLLFFVSCRTTTVGQLTKNQVCYVVGQICFKTVQNCPTINIFVGQFENCWTMKQPWTKVKSHQNQDLWAGIGLGSGWGRAGSGLRCPENCIGSPGQPCHGSLGCPANAFSVRVVMLGRILRFPKT